MVSASPPSPRPYACSLCTCVQAGLCLDHTSSFYSRAENVDAAESLQFCLGLN